MPFLDEHHLLLDCCAVAVVVGALHRNWLHRIAVIGAATLAMGMVPSKASSPWWMQLALAIVVFFQPPWANRAWSSPQPEIGSVFVTGADSGMGEATVLHLTKSTKYQRIYAGCFNLKDTAPKLKQLVGEEVCADGNSDWLSGRDCGKMHENSISVGDDLMIWARCCMKV